MVPQSEKGWEKELYESVTLQDLISAETRVLTSLWGHS